MQERVTPLRQDAQYQSDTVLIQYNRDAMVVGLSLEPFSTVPEVHFVDAIYGDKAQKIGEIFYERLKQEGWSFDANTPDHKTSDSKAEWDAKIGRAILDAVTGSHTFDGPWSWLDRPSINRLIRLLRKARDFSFGKDE